MSLRDKISTVNKRWMFAFISFTFIVVMYLSYRIGWMPSFDFYLALILVLQIFILYLCKSRNAWDIFFYNFVSVPILLFIIGIIANDANVWEAIVWGIVIIFTGEKIMNTIKKIKTC